MIHRILAALVALSFAVGAHATTRSATPETFRSVLAASQPGDTMVLSGTFRFATWYPIDWTFTTPLTIDATNATMVSFRAIRLNGVRFVNGRWTSGDGQKHAFYCYQCSRVTIFSMSASSMLNYGGNAIYFFGGRDFVVEDLTSVGFLNAVTFNRTYNFRASRGDLSGMGSDGIDVANSQNGVIEDFYVHDGKLYGASHPDGVQLWSNGDWAQTAHVTVRRMKVVGNFQGVTAFNHKAQGQIGFTDINFTDNEIHIGWSPNGVALYACTGGSIVNNHVSTYPGAKYQAHFYLVNSPGVVRYGNTVAAYGNWPAIVDQPWSPVGRKRT